MAQIALSFDAFLDNASSTIEDTNAIKTLKVDADLDTSSGLIEDTTVIRTVKFDGDLDTSRPQLVTSTYIGTSLDCNLETSTVTAETNKIHKASINGYLDTAHSYITASVISPLAFDGELDTASFNVVPSLIQNVGFDGSIDTSATKITEVTRAILGEPPFGELKVDVRGVDVSLNGFSLLKNGTYPINVWIYWDRLSAEGTDLVFTIKQSTNPAQVPYATRTTDGNGITIITIAPHGTTGLDELKAQIVLRPDDMVGLPNRSTKLYYELLLRDSLNEDYVIDRGSFTVNPSV